VFLDTRKHGRADEAIEPAISAAASLIRAGRGRTHQIRLVTTDNYDSGFVDSRGQVEAIMENLAVLHPSQGPNMRPALDRLARISGGTLVALLPSATTPDEQSRVVRLRTRYGRVIVVLFDDSSWDTRARPATLRADQAGGVHVSSDHPFADAWDQFVNTRRARASVSS
jgi:uncharacterized protein (DUF58 family)